MKYTISKISLTELDVLRADYQQQLSWPHPFVLPVWLKVWWDIFGSGHESFIHAVQEDGKIIGIAPLMKTADVVSFLGATDVCDYQDFVTAPGKENVFFSALLDNLKKQGIRSLNLAHVRPDSVVLNSLVPLAQEKGCVVETTREDISFEMDLPGTFDGYLESLTTKQRHEVKRKLRRLTEEGTINYRFISKEPELSEALGTFYRMFVESRQDKAAFLTDKMKVYFNTLVATLADSGLLRLGVLELDNKPVAEILCFEYQSCMYLYNSGYDPQYVGLSAGLLSKVMAIKDSIDKGIKKFDFLKGPEPYKAHLGGKEVPLFRCRIEIKYE
jgi:CelD/BcsL family acetyltransferase involved in cellulose biosynthesis